MKEFIKTTVKSSVRKLGFEIKRYNVVNSLDLQRRLMLKYLNIENVIDVGANSGQYATSLRDNGFRGKIISFEPLRSAHEKLKSKSATDPDWTVAERVAVGSFAGEVPINVSSNSVSSSILLVNDTHVKAAPESRSTRSELVPVKTLDNLVRGRLDLSRPTFLKIDTQGYESEVLAGAADLLGVLIGIEIELSLVPLYEDQKLFSELDRRLLGLGFENWGLWPEFASPYTGRVLQLNGLYIRTPSDRDKPSLQKS